MKVTRVLSVILFAILVLAACGPACDNRSSGDPAPAASSTGSTRRLCTVAPTATPVPSPPRLLRSRLALAQKGHLLICTDFPYPPQEYL